MIQIKDPWLKNDPMYHKSQINKKPQITDSGLKNYPDQESLIKNDPDRRSQVEKWSQLQIPGWKIIWMTDPGSKYDLI